VARFLGLATPGCQLITADPLPTGLHLGLQVVPLEHLVAEPPVVAPPLAHLLEMTQPIE